ncbi:ABC transporter substrate-binding protein [Litorisediminicola beolgyonensis]|uniref:ABC transporter substrate-binding protein n=1 Tax=Litorisediminicola beolgyonensis TaxID=1173614 RepID=A0ABW3ZFX2_9RHOB
MRTRLFHGLAAISLTLSLSLPATATTQVAQEGLTVEIGYLRQEVARPPTLTERDIPPADLGLKGAELGISENATTGMFLGQSYSLSTTVVPEGGDVAEALASAVAGSDLILLDAPAETLIAAADAYPETLFFNVSAPDVSLRAGDCRPNLLHTLPSYAMRADALAQMLVWAQWRDIALITGPHPADRAFGAAIEASLTKFGLEIGSRADWTIDADLRRSAGTEVRMLTQGLGEFDVLLVADEVHDFGRYLLYNTWLPRPVMGSEGLVPSAWAPVIEQWGALQLQGRFHDIASRDMQDVDYAAWAAVRSIGEAVTRTGVEDVATLREFILGSEFELAGFKGKPMSFRDWNGQLRQPIALAHPRALAGEAPFDGFLHQTDPLDTLGLDRSDAGCTAFGG